MTQAEAAAVEMSPSSAVGRVLRVELNVRVEWLGLVTGKAGRGSEKLEGWTFPRVDCEGQRRGLATHPLISKHCQTS